MMLEIIFSAFGFSVLEIKYLQIVSTKLLELFFWLKNIADSQLIPCKPTPLTPYLSPLFFNSIFIYFTIKYWII